MLLVTSFPASAAIALEVEANLVTLRAFHRVLVNALIAPTASSSLKLKAIPSRPLIVRNSRRKGLLSFQLLLLLLLLLLYLLLLYLLLLYLLLLLLLLYLLLLYLLLLYLLLLYLLLLYLLLLYLLLLYLLWR
jgi:hypothetical protein